jgi:formylglycine-generating enzyme required for sulfatase activity
LGRISPSEIRFFNPRQNWPPQQVQFKQSFAVGRFAVTFDEWDACVDDGGCGGYRPADLGWGRGRQPVINVSWDDAKAYVAWLAQKTGKPYRLMSSAEREYVTRAGTATPFWWGAAITLEQATFSGLSGGDTIFTHIKPMPVDSFAPNPWGFYQVHGNVWDWVEDCWDDRDQQARSDGSARTREPCGHHLLRGGSWADREYLLRSGSYSFAATRTRSDHIGFRIARALDP